MDASNAVTSTEANSLKRHASWRSAFIISLGGSLLVAVSLGPMAADLGPASVVVWTLTALVGLVQCLLITELAGMFPHKAGGTATYTHEAFRDKPLLGAFSNWGYWLGWLPVIPVNLILAAGYLNATILPHTGVLTIALVLGVAMYALNYFGLRPGVWSSAVVAVCAFVPLAIIAFSPIFKPSLFHAQYVFPMRPLGGSWLSGASWVLVIKWMFVAVWSSYAFESASSVVAELKDPHKEAPRAITAAAVVGVLVYGLVPFMLLSIVGTDALAKDPMVAFLPAAKAIFGDTGAAIVAIMLIAALLLGVMTAIIGSSRTVYEMSRDGLTLHQFARLNKHGVPVGSMYWDAAVTLTLLLVFKDNVVNIVAASNVGYIIPFILIPVAYVRLRRLLPDFQRPFKLAPIFGTAALVIAAYNAFLLAVGGPLWGGKVMLTGGIIMLTFVPFYAIRRSRDRRRQVATAVAPA